jgi:hypothetical protein
MGSKCPSCQEELCDGMCMSTSDKGTEATPYQIQKIADRYGSYSSQADVMRDDAKMPGMYNNSIAAGGCKQPLFPGDPVELPKISFDLTAPSVTAEKLSENKVSYEISNIPNEQAMRIVLEVLPKVLRLYLSKSRDYNGNVMAMLKLGPKASFVDLWRKVGKLKSALWDDQPMQGEQADEILADCVGHILITLDEMNQQC